jgi:hypothetical protein
MDFYQFHGGYITWVYIRLHQLDFAQLAQSSTWSWQRANECSISTKITSSHTIARPTMELSSSKDLLNSTLFKDFKRKIFVNDRERVRDRNLFCNQSISSNKSKCACLQISEVLLCFEASPSSSSSRILIWRCLSPLLSCSGHFVET